MQIVVLLLERTALTIVNAQAKDTVVPRPLQALVLSVRKEILSVFRSPIEERAQIAFVLDSAIEGVVAIQRQPVAARLKILPTVGNL